MSRIFCGSFLVKFALLVCLLLTISFVASADTVDTFVYESNSITYTWTLPASPTVSQSDVYPGWGFVLENVPVSENPGGVQWTMLTFYTLFCSGGFDIQLADMSFLASTTDVQVYTGSEANPIFTPGVYALTDWANPDATSNGVLTITSSAIPEPSSSTLLLLGLGILAALSLKRLA